MTDSLARRRPGARRGQAAEDLQTVILRTKRGAERRLARLFASESARARRLDPLLGHVVDALADLTLRGGKRLRAALVVVGERVAGGRHPQAALHAGVALELLQAYFLAQDDWMDRDRLRRGGPSVHVLLREHVASPRLAGIGAVLAGDYAQALATGALANLRIPPARLGKVLRCFAEMQADAVLGQQLDVLGDSPNPQLVCLLKTASYTVRGPLLLGAQLGGAKPSVLRALAEFSTPVGVGFQLRDDLLGTFGDPRLTGKPRGNDWRQGKPTELARLGFARAKGVARERLRRAFGNPKATSAEVARAIEVLDACGARRLVEQRIARLARRAQGVLDGSRLPRVGRGLLEQSIPLLLGRPS